MRDLSWNQKEPIEELIEACRYRNPKVAPGLCNAAAAQLKLFKELQQLAGEELLAELEREKRDSEVLEPVLTICNCREHDLDHVHIKDVQLVRR